MTTEAKRADALQFIFSLFLGILLSVLVGAGVWTFYPDPYGENSPQQEKLEELYQQQEQINMRSGGVKAPSAADQAAAKRVQDEIDAINDEMSAGRDAWAVTTSIILVICATILMAISLLLPEHMKVFSNGVLLGGLFTMIYGTGWSFAGGNSRARFFVVLVAVVITVLFGYLRFVRGRKEAEATASSAAGKTLVEVGPIDEPALALMAARIDALEARTAAAAAALGDFGDKSD